MKRKLRQCKNCWRPDNGVPSINCPWCGARDWEQIYYPRWQLALVLSAILGFVAAFAIGSYFSLQSGDDLFAIGAIASAVSFPATYWLAPKIGREACGP